MRAKSSVVVTLAVLLLSGSVTWAQNVPPRLIPFQARLTDAAGATVPDGVYGLTFNIYETETGGESCWSEAHGTVSVVGGVVNVILGAMSSLEDINFNPTAGTGCDPQSPSPGTSCDCRGIGLRFLGITIGQGPEEMVPRHQLVPAFHARRADIAARVEPNSITRDMIRDGEVTSNKIGVGAVTGAKIADGTVTGSDLMSGTISAAQIALGSLTANLLSTTPGQRIGSAQIEDGGISAEKLNVEGLKQPRFHLASYEADGEFVVPQDVANVIVFGAGGGGGGGGGWGGTSGARPGGGGGAGAPHGIQPVSVLPGWVCDVTIGSGGAGGAVGTGGGTGATSVFSCEGGANGAAFAGGLGGISVSSGAAAGGRPAATGAGGGSGATSTTNNDGIDGSYSHAFSGGEGKCGGGGGGSEYGNGGDGADPFVGGVGDPGGPAGGGGGGCSGGTGGNGGPGRIFVGFVTRYY